jgi:hypothetical protein
MTRRSSLLYDTYSDELDDETVEKENSSSDDDSATSEPRNRLNSTFTDFVHSNILELKREKRQKTLTKSNSKVNMNLNDSY